LGLAKARLTLAMLDRLATLTSVEQTAVMLNIHLEEHTVVAWLLWCRLAPLATAAFPPDTVPLLLLDHITYAKPLLDQLRLLPSNAPTTDLQLLLVLRKFHTLCGRDLQPADWATEQANSRSTYADRTRVLGARRYYQLFRQHSQMAALRTISVTYNQRLPTLDTWWARRLVSTPSGSSSNRHSVDEYRTPLHASTDRPNKRVVYAHAPNDWPAKLLALEPHCIARCSTKPEPGRRRRALYAACDCSTVLASWASYGLEDAMRWGGMVARQAPSDVHSWLQHHASSQAVGGVWLSLDYSDFNKEHRWWELAAINLDLAKAWLTHPQRDIVQSKHSAAIWTAQSHRARWATEGSTTWMPLHGLFSGHRDTGRDNTLLHQIYQEIQLTVANDLCADFRRPITSYKCGDDEDTWFPTDTDALLYYGVGAAMGWHFNPRKQMLGPAYHEFLQFMCAGTDGPSQPLVPSLVAFVSGNWYKDPLADIAGMAEAIVRVGIELISRCLATAYT
jgi:hypothetical protein